MSDINSVVLVGRLVRNAELVYTKTGAAICKFSIAINRNVRKDNEWKDEANFFDVVLFGRLGESVNKYLVKGTQVAIQGELSQNRWEQDGQTRSKVEIIASNVRLMGGTRGSGQQNNSDASYSAPVGNNDFGSSNDFEDDIPF